eukprot:326090_1
MGNVQNCCGFESEQFNQNTTTSISYTTTDETTFTNKKDVINVEVNTVDAQRTGAGRQESYLIIDVRKPHELNNGYNIGLTKSEEKDWVNIEKHVILTVSNKNDLEKLLAEEKYGSRDMNDYQDLYFLCGVGVRSLAAAKHVQTFDIEQNLFNITGGMKAWKNQIGLNNAKL